MRGRGTADRFHFSMAECLDKDAAKDKRPKGAVKLKRHVGRTLKRRKETSSLRFSFFTSSALSWFVFELRLKQVFGAFGSGPVRLVVERDHDAVMSTPVALQDSSLKISTPAPHVHHSQVVSAASYTLTPHTHCVIEYSANLGGKKKYKSPLLWKLQLK